LPGPGPPHARRAATGQLRPPRRARQRPAGRAPRGAGGRQVDRQAHLRFRRPYPRRRNSAHRTRPDRPRRWHPAVQRAAPQGAARHQGVRRRGGRHPLHPPDAAGCRRSWPNRGGRGATVSRDSATDAHRVRGAVQALGRRDHPGGRPQSDRRRDGDRAGARRDGRTGHVVSCRTAILALVLLPASLVGQYFDRTAVRDGSIDASGSQVAYTLREADIGADRFVNQVYLVAAQGGTPRLIGSGWKPTFAPVGTALARLDTIGSRTTLVVRDNPDATDRDI